MLRNRKMYLQYACFLAKQEKTNNHREIKSKFMECYANTSGHDGKIPP